jgi:uncharacterized membrane protein
MKSRLWLTYALVTTASWGVWGAFTGVPADHGFPETLIYAVWALTMIPPALYALRRVGWRLQHDARSICYGALIGLLGAGGQMLLFHAVRTGPAYLIFPVISLSPVVTVVLSMALLHERTRKLGALGIVLALCSLPLFDYAGSAGAGAYGQLWFLPALGVLLAWGVQAFFMKLAVKAAGHCPVLRGQASHNKLRWIGPWFASRCLVKLSLVGSTHSPPLTKPGRRRDAVPLRTVSKPFYRPCPA